MPQVQGQEVGAIGYGLMGLTWRATPPPEEQAFAAMRAALEGGCNFWNGGEFYGAQSYNSLVLLERYFAQYPEDADKVVLSIKGAVSMETGPDGSPDGVRRSIDNVLSQLGGRKRLDIFECARRDPKVPMRDTFAAIQEYVDKGLLGGISLSEVSAATIHEAVKVAKIVAVEVELSLWATDVLTNGVAAACAQYNIPLVAYSPIGRGMLTGKIKSVDDIPEDSMLRNFPRFRPENFDINLQLVKQVEEIAQKKGCTPAQLAIAWTRSLSQRPGMPVIIPIPGATTVERVRENSNAKDVRLSIAELDEIDATLDKFEIRGGRYPENAHIET